MLFISPVYIFLFLPITVIIYFFLNKKHLTKVSTIWLIGMSLFFYGYWNVKYLPILLFSVVFNFFAGKLISHSVSATEFGKFKINGKVLLAISIIVNLCLLGYFKYMDFFISNINAVFHCDIKLLHILLPIGISFFTFQQIAYLADSYKGLTKEYSFIKYALFVVFFPQLIAGPIVHHKEMMPQFDKLRAKVLNHKNLVLGLYLFTFGLFKKVVLADTFSQYVAWGYSPETVLNMTTGWLVALSYTFQIYFDFSGYSDMAIGAGRMFNINLPFNFDSPYKSKSVQEFWRRWHITLSRFLRDYIYIPLGGSRVVSYKIYRNLLLTMLIGGLWHGANWTFVLWGGLHGLGLCINRIWKNFTIVLSDKLCWFLTFLFINIAWVFFRANSIPDAMKILKPMFALNHFKFAQIDAVINSYVLWYKDYPVLNAFITLSIIVSIWAAFKYKNTNEIFSGELIKSRKSAILISLLFIFLFIFSILKIIIQPYTEFIYFNF